MPVAGEARQGFSGGLGILPVMNGDPVAGGGEKPCRGTADAPGCARDEHDFALCAHDSSIGICYRERLMTRRWTSLVPS